MKNQSADPKIKNTLDDEEIIEQDENVDTNEEIIDNEEHEWVNPSDLDAVDPDDIAIGEEYF